MEEKVDPSVGFVIASQPQDRVSKGQRLATIHARTKKDLEVGRSVLEKAIVIAGSAPVPLPLISHRITASGVETLA